MIFYRITAEFIFVLHCVVVAVIAFGWVLPSLRYLYLAVLVATLFSMVAFGHCFLSKWEFFLRRKINPHLDYNYSFSSYYTYALTQHRLSEQFIYSAGLAFLIASLALNIYLL